VPPALANRGAGTLGVQLYDHIIVGKDGHASLRGMKLI
jgi:DNA repair protein RadC